MLNNTREWCIDVRLLLDAGANSGRVVEVGSGRLGDMISLALSRPESERSRLFIRPVPGPGEMDWAQISALAARADCPVVI